METWFLIGGLALVAVFNAVIAAALTRDRARRESHKNTLRLDQLDADIEFLSGRITKNQKQKASEASVEARAETKSLKQQAMEQLVEQMPPVVVNERPSVVNIRGVKR